MLGPSLRMRKRLEYPPWAGHGPTYEEKKMRVHPPPSPRGPCYLTHVRATYMYIDCIGSFAHGRQVKSLLLC